ncbi:hypothetical protein Bpfe_020993 [Biomphalaria pfeifferi]|uniref:Uncharacterized protein n=1 Tax=Biomphalaria pfeifferi TaxID=112525 RepID=A0AAD8B7Z5_BIOPF|nr:hypothetical protein Bpfe_020993 [Biomphalaria pfeifferi]
MALSCATFTFKLILSETEVKRSNYRPCGVDKRPNSPSQRFPSLQTISNTSIRFSIVALVRGDYNNNNNHAKIKTAEIKKRSADENKLKQQQQKNLKMFLPAQRRFPNGRRGRFSTFSSAISRHYLYIQNTKGLWRIYGNNTSTSSGALRGKVKKEHITPH